jgi:hypothetical protein
MIGTFTRTSRAIGYYVPAIPDVDTRLSHVMTQPYFLPPNRHFVTAVVSRRASVDRPRDTQKLDAVII